MSRMNGEPQISFNMDLKHNHDLHDAFHETKRNTLIDVYQAVAASKSIGEALNKIEAIYKKDFSDTNKLVPF